MFNTILVALITYIIQIMLKTIVCYSTYKLFILPYSHYIIDFWYMCGIVLFTEFLTAQPNLKD